MADQPQDDASFQRGHVVWHPGVVTTSGRPWVVVSDTRHPFHGEEYLVVGITTTDRETAIQLTDDAWALGGLPRTSYVSPWFVTTVKHADIDRGIGMLTEFTVESLLEAVRRYLK